MVVVVVVVVVVVLGVVVEIPATTSDAHRKLYSGYRSSLSARNSTNLSL
jgi:hypothetical protein